MADKLVGAARAVLGQGLGMGWGDEVEAWFQSKLLGNGTYDKNLARIRGEYGQYAKENPFTSAGLEFAGGAIPGVAALFVPGGQGAGAAQVARAAAPVMGGLAKSAAMGAATGAISGAGAADQDRLSGALAGGVIGGGIGAALPVAFRGAGSGMDWLAERLRPTESGAASRASRSLNAQLAKTNTDPAELVARMQQDKDMGVPSMLLNASPRMEKVARTVVKRAGAGADEIEKALIDQRAGGRERIVRQIGKALHPGDYYADEQSLVKDLRSRAKDVYSAAYDKGMVDDPKVNAILQHPTFQAAFEKGKKIGETEALAARLKGDADWEKYLLPEIYLPTGEMVQKPNVRTLDYVKRGLDDMIDAGFRGDSSVGRGQAGSLKALRNQFVKAIDENVPEYKTARNAYAGDMEVIDAMRSGMNDFKKLDHEQVANLVKDMSEAEKQAFRTGVARDLYSKVMDPRQNVNSAQRLIGSPEDQAKLQMLFDNPDQFKLFKSALDRESQMFQSAGRVIGGSDTAENQQLIKQFDGEDGFGQFVGNAVTGGFKSSLANLALQAMGKTAMGDMKAAKLADMLMAKDPHKVAAVVKLLEEQAAADAPKAFRAGMREMGAVTGLAAAAPSAPTAESDISAEQPAPDGGQRRYNIEDELKSAPQRKYNIEDDLK